MIKRTGPVKSLLSILLTVSILFGITPLSAVSVPVVPETENVRQSPTEAFKAPDIIDAEEQAEKSYAGRVKEEEKDLYTFVFRNEDGSNTMRVFDHPVKYVDDKGETRDISLEISKDKDGSFKAADHMIKATFGNDLSEGIGLRYDGVRIKMTAKTVSGEKESVGLSSDGKKLTYAVDGKTSYVYSLTYCGIKEDIVVNEYTGQTEYEFTLNTNGLHPVKIDGSVFLADNDEEIKASIGDIIIFTADNRNNAFGDLQFEAVEENSEYKFTIVLDPDYLRDEKTAYPITIDPTIEYIDFDDGIIEDITIAENTTYRGDLGSLYVGLDSNGYIMRSLMKFHEFTVPVSFGPLILSASVEIRDLMCQSNQNMEIYCYAYNENSPTWYESQTNTWNSLGTNITSTLADHHLVTFGNGNVTGQQQRYSFDITNIAKEWAGSARSPEKGLVFTAGSAFESNGTTGWYKTFASVNRSANQPSLSITYETMGIFTLMTYVSLTFEDLQAIKSDKTVQKATFSQDHKYDGTFLWCIKAVPNTQFVTITSLGMRYNGGEKGYSLQTNYIKTSLVMENDSDPSCQFKAELYNDFYYTFRDVQTNLYMSYSISSNKLLFSYVKDFSCGIVPVKINTDTFNNFWSGGYSVGTYSNTTHIKVQLDPSISTHDLYSNFDFSSALWWNDIVDNIVIYGPNDIVPNGIIPFVVTYSLSSKISTSCARTIPNGITPEGLNAYTTSQLNALITSNWNSATIYLNAGENSLTNPFYTIADEDERSAYVEKTICHEMGHALKLSHPSENNNSGKRHEFEGCRGDYSGQTAVYAVMNQGRPNSSTSLSALMPQSHDIINLISKTEYHMNCSH